MTSSTASAYLPVSPSSSSKRKVKTKIIKTYHHDIRVTYDRLISTTDSALDDSDPEETQHLLSTMRLNSGRSCLGSVDTSRSDRATRTKYSIGGISAVDSGVVSHDSLLDRYQDMSTTTRSERSESPCSRYSIPTRYSTSPSRGEFDPLNRTVLLDSKVRSNSRSRLEEQQRGKSPCRSHGVRDMIHYFEGSQENLNSNTVASLSLRSAAQPPAIKPPLHTTPISPLRLARGRRITKHKPGSPTTLSPEHEEPRSTTPTRNKQDSSLRLTCVASGYSKYSPSNERKTYSNKGDGDHQSVGSAKSTQKLNGATSSSVGSLDNSAAGSAALDNGVTSSSDNRHITNGHIASHGDGITPDTQLNGESINPKINGDTLQINGSSEDTTSQLDNVGSKNSNISNNQLLVNEECNKLVSCDEVDISIVDSEKTTPVIANGNVDEVDRTALKLALTDVPSVKLPTEEPKLTNGIDSNGIHDSPSKKNGEWFLKVTDNAQERLESLCDVAQKDLELTELTEEVSGQIRAAIGKAHLLVNKKFKQFRGLCHKNLTQGPDEPFPTTSQDLAGFWDLVYIQVENCESNFSDIDALRANGWVQQPKIEPVEPPHHKKPTTPRGHKSIVGASTDSKGKEKSAASKPNGAAKARDEARKRLMAAKRAMRERRNSETEDVIFVSTS